MARLAVTQEQSSLSSHRTLFQHFLPRYLANPAVRAFLMDASPAPPNSLPRALISSLSYGCMYYPPTSNRHAPSGTHSIPQPFLDFGDFMLCDQVHDGIAVGHLFNSKMNHPLALIRDRMMPKKSLSKTAVARKFACDLSASNLEIIEFAWMTDHSLIIGCRRLDYTDGTSFKDSLILSGDLLFYDIIPEGEAPDVPLLRMTLAEKPSICQFCGTRGVKTCTCPSQFKRRAPSPASVPIPYSHAAFPHDNTRLGLVPRGPLASRLATWDCYAKRIFQVNTQGSFFVNWYRRSKTGGMTLFLSPPHPISYQFVCGTRSQTLSLASLYLKKLRVCERSSYMDTRLHTVPLQAKLGQAQNQQSVFSDETRGNDSTESILGSDDGGVGLRYFDTRSSSDPWDNTTYLQQPVYTQPLQHSITSASPTSSGLMLPHTGLMVMQKEDELAEQQAEKVIEDYNSILRDSHTYSNFPLDVIPQPASLGPPCVPSAQGAILEDILDSGERGLRLEKHSSHGLGERVSKCLPELLLERMTCDVRASKSVMDVSPVSPAEKLRAMDVALDKCHRLDVDCSKSCAPRGRKASNSPTRRPRYNLSTTNKEIQMYMTVNANNTPTCKECGSSFHKRGNLARHIQTVHLKLKPFQCEQCDATFGYKNHLKRHMSVHERGGAYKCGECNVKFKRIGQYNKHMATAHGDVRRDAREGNGSLDDSESKAHASIDKNDGIDYLLRQSLLDPIQLTQ